MTNKKWHNVLSDYTKIIESVTLDDLQGRYALEWLNAAKWQPVRSVCIVIAGPLVLEIT